MVARTYTIAFHINDMEAFERDHPNIKALAMANFDATTPYCVAGLSIANEINRSTMIGQILEYKDLFSDRLDSYDCLEMIGELLNCFEPEDFAKFKLDWEWDELETELKKLFTNDEEKSCNESLK